MTKSETRLLTSWRVLATDAAALWLAGEADADDVARALDDDEYGEDDA